MGKNLARMCMLYDAYGGILTDKQRELFELYYNEDLSLSEISQNEGITRQGVRDAVVRAVQVMEETEQKLGFVEKGEKIRETARIIKALAGEIGKINETNYYDERIKRFAEELVKAAEAME